jgi:hypothetical protein
MKICFFGCLIWFDCNLDITPSSDLSNAILTEDSLPILTEDAQPLIIE